MPHVGYQFGGLSNDHHMTLTISCYQFDIELLSKIYDFHQSDFMKLYSIEIRLNANVSNREHASEDVVSRITATVDQGAMPLCLQAPKPIFQQISIGNRFWSCINYTTVLITVMSWVSCSLSLMRIYNTYWELYRVFSLCFVLYC